MFLQYDKISGELVGKVIIKIQQQWLLNDNQRNLSLTK